MIEALAVFNNSYSAVSPFQIGKSFVFCILMSAFMIFFIIALVEFLLFVIHFQLLKACCDVLKALLQ